MIVTDQIEEVRTVRWLQPSRSWGLVPTMGYLHEGHLSLVRRARSENDRIAVSIFVNPTQFAPDEDLGVYPKDLQRDLSLLEEEQVDLVYVPGDQQIYPPGFQTSVNISQVTGQLEGASRPMHFQGVATVVAKLFNIFEPTKAYFGQKDAQQTVVIRRLARDLNFNLSVVICPTSDSARLSSFLQRLSSLLHCYRNCLFLRFPGIHQFLNIGIDDLPA